MSVTEVTAVPGTALPIPGFRDHLRMGSGFSDDAVQDGLLDAHLRAALAAIEGRAGKALIARDFLWTVAGWRDGLSEAFPVAPVVSVSSVTVRDRTGAGTAVAASAWLVTKDRLRPEIAGAGALLPTVPEQGVVEIAFTGGFGAWASVPPDLAQAVFLLAAHYHENRFVAGEGPGLLPFGVMALIERWRPIRITGGRT